MEPTRKNSTSEMSSVLRTLKVLEAVSEKQPVSLSELGKVFDYSKSTLQRSLTTLHAAGWIRQGGPNNYEWEISTRSLLVRPRSLRGGQLYAAAREPMIELGVKTNETIHLSIMDNLQVATLIDRVDCAQAIRTYSPIGVRSPLHATSIGRAMMAFLPENQIDLILAQPLERFTENTLVTAEAVRSDLEVIRQRGFSVNIEEYRKGVFAIGAPIINEHGLPIAGICISAPLVRFDEQNIELWGAWTKEAAQKISY